jgi:16S rRNA processing protein RimM
VPGRSRIAGSRRPARPEPAPADLIVVGRIGRPQGIKGEVTVEVRTDDPDDRFAPGAVLRTDPAERGPLTVEGSRMQGRYLVVAFEDVPDRNAAELLRDTMLLVPVADLPPLADEDEYYDSELVGLAAELVDGTGIGTVVDVLHLPHGDVLAIERPSLPELLVPFVKAIVPVVDVPASRVVIDPPPGLLELGEPSRTSTDDGG